MRLKFILGLLAAGLTGSAAYAQTNPEDTYEFVFLYQDNTAYITGIKPGVKLSGAVTIPGSVTIDGRRFEIQKIQTTHWNYYGESEPRPVFLDQTEITSIHIPSTITSIESNSFRGCKKLKEFTVSSANPNFKVIDGSLYVDRGGIMDLVRFPPARTSTGFTLPAEVHYISHGAFADNYTVTTIRLSQWQELSAGAMDGNLGVTKFELNDSYMYDSGGDGGYLIGKESNVNVGILMAVAPRYKMGGLLTIPSSINTIGYYALAGSRATSIAIPSSVKTINNYAFACSALTTVTVPSTVTEPYPEGWFYNCTSLTSVNIKCNISEIEESMFEGCTSLTSFEVPTSAKSLGRFCFRGCTSLKTLNGLYRFPTLDSDGFQFAGSGLETVNLPSAWKEIPQGMFYGCANLKSATLSDGVQIIKEEAFKKSGLETINLRSTVEVEDDAFLTATPMRKIIMPASENSLTLAWDCFNLAQGGEIYIDRKSMVGVDWYEFLDGKNPKPVIYTSKRAFTYFFHEWDKLYVPAGSRPHYRNFADDYTHTEEETETFKQNIFEMFSYSDIKVNQRSLTVKPSFSWVKITGVTINGTDATASGTTWSAPKAPATGNTMNVVISFTANDIKMSTEYNLSETSGLEELNASKEEGITIDGHLALFPADSQWSLHDLGGRLCLSGQGESADFSELERGIYILTARTDSGRLLTTKISR